ncbi:MAG TPA: DUF4397 domain-containing protein [Flavobacteriales bacterium]|nr:DUF4397 domain-containing protein [Flavobacteriales bacterium]
MLTRTTLIGAALAAGIPATAQVARLQVIHNSADAAASVVDVYVNGSLLIDDFAFRTAWGYNDVPAGVDLQVGIAPGTSTSAADTIPGLGSTYNLPDGGTFVLVANGIVSGSGYNPSPAFDLYANGGEETTTAGNTGVLVFHGATDAPAVDVYESAVLGANAVSNLAYGGFAGYLNLPTDDYVLEVRAAGDPNTLVAYSAPLQTLGLDGLSLAVVASGFLDPAQNSNGPAFGLFAAPPFTGPLVELPVFTAPTARLQVIHNSADAAASVVDVYVNGALLIDDFGFRTAWGYNDVPAGVDLQVGIAPGTSTSAADTLPGLGATYNLPDGGTFILVANGIVSGSGYNPAPAFQLYANGGTETSTAGSTNVLVFHGATDAPAVDVFESAVLGANAVSNLAYGQFAGYLNLPTDDYVLEVRAAGDPNTLVAYSAPLQTLGLDGLGLAVVASGFLDPSQNSNGPGFGLWAALPAGGALVELPVFTAPTARLQVIHNSADAAAASVDVYVNGALLIDDFGFRTAWGFEDVPAGAALQIGVAPGTSTSAADTIPGLGATFVLADGERYVLIANGIVSGTGYNPSPAFTLNAFAPAREAAATAGNTDILVFHGSTDAPVVDVYESAVLEATAVDDLAYGSFAGYLALPTADYTIQVRTADNSAIAAAFSAPLQTLSLQDLALTVVASGFLDPAQNSNGAAFGLWVALPTGGALVQLPAAPIPTARVQVIHNSADAAASTVDVWLNDSPLIDDFAFRTASPFVDLQAGVDLNVGVAPANSTDPADAIANFSYNLEEGGTYILVANGIVSGTGYNPATPFNIYVYTPARETATSGAGNTDILVFHGSTDAPTVNVNETAVLGGATLINGLSYGEFSNYLEPPTDDYVLEITAGGTPVVSYQAPLASLGLQGDAITVVASGFLDPAQNSNGPAFGLWVAQAAGGALVELPIFTGVNENAGILAATTLWPNPANDLLNIQVPALGDRSLDAELLDASGRIVRALGTGAMVRSNDRVTLATGDLAAGTYVLRLRSQDNSVALPVSIAR